MDVSPEISLAPNNFKINNSTYIGQVQTTTFAPDLNDAFQATAIPKSVQVKMQMVVTFFSIFLSRIS
ncbi:MAG: hypothetical protein IPN46_19570 [Saprospiraceae bacterium]|nr:hypothetical protein [Saprospiraceae bacterium]